METIRWALVISYDGTDFCGWQRQKYVVRDKHGRVLPSIQEVLENALSHLLDQPIHVESSGRTDRGVHALGQVIHFDAQRRRWPRQWDWALRGWLPSAIVVKRALPVQSDFHARYWAVAKTYWYYVWNRVPLNPFWSRFSWWEPKPLDLSRLNQLSQVLVGEWDFKSFQNAGSQVSHTIRRIYRAQWVALKPNGLLRFEVTANGFLKQMVRNIVGTLVKLTLQGAEPDLLRQILLARDRTSALLTAPAQGLFYER